MKEIRLIAWLVLVAMLSWGGAYTGQASSQESGSASLPGYFLAAGTPSPASSPLLSTRAPGETKTPEPTRAPLPTPPPSDPDTTSMIILFGILLGVIVLFGMVVNSRRIF